MTISGEGLLEGAVFLKGGCYFISIVTQVSRKESIQSDTAQSSWNHFLQVIFAFKKPFLIDSKVVLTCVP